MGIFMGKIFRGPTQDAKIQESKRIDRTPCPLILMLCTLSPPEADTHNANCMPGTILSLHTYFLI